MIRNMIHIYVMIPRKTCIYLQRLDLMKVTVVAPGHLFSKVSVEYKSTK